MAVQKDHREKSVAFLRQLGLTTDEISVYLYLLQNGSQTVLSLSRGLSSGRTKLYPVVEALVSRQLVEIKEKHYGTSFSALSPENINFLIARKELDAVELRHSFPAVLHSLNNIFSTSDAVSEITEYRGLEGIRDMKWNMTRKKNLIIRGLNVPATDRALGSHFNSKIDNELSKKGSSIQILSNGKSRTRPLPTAGSGMPTGKNVTVRRKLELAIYKIEEDAYIYANTVAIIRGGTEDKILRGVEIRSADLAQQYKNLFDVLWNQAA